MVPGVGASGVVGQGFRGCEFVVTTQRSDDVAPTRDLARQAGDGTGDLVDFGEEDDSWEFGGRVGGDGGVVEEDSLGFLLNSSWGFGSGEGTRREGFSKNFGFLISR